MSNLWTLLHLVAPLSCCICCGVFCFSFVSQNGVIEVVVNDKGWCSPWGLTNHRLEQWQCLGLSCFFYFRVFIGKLKRMGLCYLAPWAYLSEWMVWMDLSLGFSFIKLLSRWQKKVKYD